MGLFGKKIENASFTDQDLVRRAETEIEILAGELKNKNWTEVWNSLCHSELNSPSITAKMSPEAKEKFKNLIVETKEVFATEKESVDKDLVDPIQRALDRISEKF